MLKRNKYKVFPVLLSNKGNNTEHIWLSGPLELNDNDDVIITDPQDGDILIYDATINMWVNEPAGTGEGMGWGSEAHTFGESEINGDIQVGKEYFGNGLGPSMSPIPLWDTPHWNYEIDPTNFNPYQEIGAGRALPRDGVGGIVVRGYVTMPPGANVDITVYYTKCYQTADSDDDFSNEELRCLGTWNTGNPSNGSPVPNSGYYTKCFAFTCGNPWDGQLPNSGTSLGAANLIYYGVRMNFPGQGGVIKQPGLMNIINIQSSLIFNAKSVYPNDAFVCPTPGAEEPDGPPAI